jgi:hypothetical protein
MTTRIDGVPSASIPAWARQCFERGATFVGCVGLVLPVLLVADEKRQAALVIVGAAVTALAIPAGRTMSERIGALGGAIFVTIAITGLLPSLHHDGVNVWALAFPACLMVFRVGLGASLSAVTALLFLLDDGDHSWRWALVEVLLVIALTTLVSSVAKKLSRITADKLHKPVLGNTKRLLQLSSLFIVFYSLTILYFSWLYYSILSYDPAAFSRGEGLPTTTSTDLLIYSGMVGFSGEVVHVEPISAYARGATLTEMFLSTIFTAIYLAVVAGTMFDDTRRV